MPEHLVQGAGPLSHTRRGELLDACSGGCSAAPHSWLDGLKPGVFLDQIPVKRWLANSYLHTYSFGDSCPRPFLRGSEATYSLWIFVRISQQKFQLRVLAGSPITCHFASSRHSELKG